jgi:RNA 3'-terminal phosphate cyclase
MVLPMILAEGESRVNTSQISQHLLTNVWVARQFLARDVCVEGRLGAPGTVVVKGEGHD